MLEETPNTFCSGAGTLWEKVQVAKYIFHLFSLQSAQKVELCYCFGHQEFPAFLLLPGARLQRALAVNMRLGSLPIAQKHGNEHELKFCSP